MTCSVVLWVLLGTPAGYVSARLYKSKPHFYMLINEPHVNSFNKIEFEKRMI